MKMKKLIALLLVLTMACSMMLACGNNESDTPETTTTPETTVLETTVPETTVPETTVPETTVPETTEPLTLDTSDEGVAMTEAAVAFAETGFNGLFGGDALVGEENCVVSYADIMVKYFEMLAESADMTVEELAQESGYDSIEALLQDSFASAVESVEQMEVAVEALGSTLLEQWDEELAEVDANVTTLGSLMGLELTLADFLDVSTVEAAGVVTVAMTANEETETMEMVMVKVNGQWTSVYSIMTLSLLQAV